MIYYTLYTIHYTLYIVYDIISYIPYTIYTCTIYCIVYNVHTGIALDRQGYVYVADEFNNRVQMFTPDLAHVTTVVSSVPRPKAKCFKVDESYNYL